MPVTITRAQGVTVFTVTSDPKSRWPPLCQILKALCYSPSCCAASQHMRTTMGSSQAVLGALQIAVGLITIALGVLPMFGGFEDSWWKMDMNLFSLWMGPVFVLFGIVCILSQKYPSPCLVIINVILNLSGVLFAVANVILCAINIGVMNMWDVCEPAYDDRFDNWIAHTPTPSPNEKFFEKQCLNGRELLHMLLRGINGVLLLLAVLELCLAISSSILAVKALRSGGKGCRQSLDDPEEYKAFPDEDVIANPSA
ncbi:transmembrane protein 176B-like [Syngnathoides biaculeatus]|uniref:transmembrane protein 176B-like n=1 Tax=Syngnathoides biaculeatus TaxID=300417 RepID=UPI002ADD7ECE|nr:transmembrane protein 176B-like [Syngnathoides biaculeatus]XP_061675201.1 transmembrane protein 176B-like [Syngnathoides biaculeatus]